jgi:uncharacterized protein (TIGR00251 family)
MNTPPTRPWRNTKEGVVLDIRLTPRGGRDALDGIETLADGRVVLKARVRAAPTEGEANTALIRLLAQEFGLPRSQLAIVSGASARLKTVALRGESGSLAAAIETRLGKDRQAG